MATTQVLDTVRAVIIDTGRDTRYKLGAYNFVLNGLEFYLAKIGEKRHVSGQELSKGLMEFADKQFGLLTQQVLNSWGIKTTNDFGYIVYNLIDISLMCKQKGDALEDFFDVIDIGEYCKSREHFQIDSEYIRTIRGA
jgi:uncharacterized repeat protein (TIGR04138 family)